MTTIYKYPFTTTDVVKLKMPKGATILSLQTQGGTPCIWAMVDNEAANEERSFEVFGTGHPVPAITLSERNFIGTYQLMGGALVFHVFELITPF